LQSDGSVIPDQWRLTHEGFETWNNRGELTATRNWLILFCLSGKLKKKTFTSNLFYAAIDREKIKTHQIVCLHR
jgi:hypothetical protein